MQSLNQLLQHRNSVEFSRLSRFISGVISGLPWYSSPKELSLAGREFRDLVEAIVPDILMFKLAVCEVTTEGSDIFSLFPIPPMTLSLSRDWTPSSSKDETRWVYRSAGITANLSDRQTVLFPQNLNFDVTAEELLATNALKASLITTDNISSIFQPFEGDDRDVLQRLIDADNELVPPIIAIAQIIGRGINRMLRNLDLETTFNWGFADPDDYTAWANRHELARIEAKQAEKLLGY
jgi:hypothetical protein